MNIVVMWMVVFTLSGEVKPGFKEFPEGFLCSDAAARTAAEEWAATKLNGIPIQPDVLWSCVNVISPGPIRPALYLGQTEAHL